MSAVVKILNGNTFVVSDERGDVEASLTDPTGLFSFDTRFLSRWILTVDGQRLNPLSVDDLQYFETRFFLVPGTGTVYIDAKLSVIRQRAISDGFREELTILNHDEEPVDLEVRIEAASDFADLFEVKDDIAKKGEYYSRVDDEKLVLGYRRETYVRETWVSATGPATLDEHGLSFAVRVEPHGQWTTELNVAIGLRPARQRGRAGGRRDAGPPGRVRHGGEPQEVARRRPHPRLRLGPAQAHVPPLARRPGRAEVLAGLAARPLPAGRRAALVHDHVRPRQHLHQPAGAAVQRRPGAHHAGGAGHVAGVAPRRLPRRGPGPHPARTALRRDDGVRGASALTVLRLGRRDAAVSRAARRVRTLDRRREARPRPGARSTGGPGLDRRLRRPAGQRLHRLPATQREDRAREPVLEGLVGLDLLPRRAPAGLSAGDVRAAGLRLRRQDARRPPRARSSGRTRASATGSRRRPPSSSAASTATSGSRTASTSPSPSSRTAARSTAWPPTTATCCGAASSTPPRPRPWPAT